MNTTPNSTTHPWVHALAVFTAISVFPLLFVGASVTSTESGMVYETGFLSDGVLWNPPGWFSELGTRVEHGHRILGRIVGILAILLFISAWRVGGAVRLLSLLTLLAIVAQGIMGILRVNLISTGWAMVHGVWGQACFALACVTALVTSPSWIRRAPPMSPAGATLLRRLSVVVSGAVFLQLVLGATLRHFNSGHALVAHALFAVLIVFLVGWLVMWTAGQFPRRGIVRIPSTTLGGLTALQLMLGGLAWLNTMAPASSGNLWTWLVPTMHVAVGSLILVSSVLLTIGLFDQVRPDAANAPVRMEAMPTS